MSIGVAFSQVPILAARFETARDSHGACPEPAVAIANGRDAVNGRAATGTRAWEPDASVAMDPCGTCCGVVDLEQPAAVAC